MLSGIFRRGSASPAGGGARSLHGRGFIDVDLSALCPLEVMALKKGLRPFHVIRLRSQIAEGGWFLPPRTGFQS